MKATVVVKCKQVGVSNDYLLWNTNVKQERDRLLNFFSFFSPVSFVVSFSVTTAMMIP